MLIVSGSSLSLAEVVAGVVLDDVDDLRAAVRTLVRDDADEAKLMLRSGAVSEFDVEVEVVVSDGGGSTAVLEDAEEDEEDDEDGAVAIAEVI